MNVAIAPNGTARRSSIAATLNAPMQHTNHNPDDDGIVALLKEIADGFGLLMAAHVKLARCELLADMKSLGRRLTTLAAAISFAFLGYAFICLGVAVVLSRWLSPAGSLLLVGGVHLAGATSALFVAVRRLRNTDLMPETTHATGQSVSTLTTRILHGQGRAAAAPERTMSGALVKSANESERGSPIAAPHA